MAIKYPEILSLGEKDQHFSYDERDTMLYALGVGFGRDPHDLNELRFVYEDKLKAIPSLATVVAWGAGVPTRELGVNYKMVLHGEEEIIFHQPMPPAADLSVDSTIKEVYDKGEGRGALIHRQVVLKDRENNSAIATINRYAFARADGGFGGSTSSAPKPHNVPERKPGLSVVYETRSEQAAIYRLCGDRNPLHIDPAVAKSAGFDRPILHGLATYGITCRAVLENFCDFDPANMGSHAVRFSSPFYPGESLQVDMWKDGNVISFEAVALERGVKVIKNGKSTLI